MAPDESTESRRATFAEWAAARQQKLLRTAFLLTSGDRHLAEDLVQDALAKVAARWRRLEHGNPDAYIQQILVRTSISWWRLRRRERLVEQVPDSRVEDGVESADRQHIMTRALARLTDRQRAVVVLRYYEDLTEAQVADLLNVTVGTVKSQTHAALSRLRSAAPELTDLKGDTP